MKRRHFLQIAAVGTAAAGIPLTSSAATAEAVPRALDALAHPQILQRIGAHRLIREIGDAYRDRNSRENDADRLASLIRADLPEGVAMIQSREGELLAALDRRIRSDFEHGRTVELRGWILSVTEARQCALYSVLYA